MSVVHLWNGHGNIGGTWSLNQCVGETWCGAGVDPGDDAVLCDDTDRVTCKTCLGMASDFGGTCRARLRDLVEDAPLGEGDTAARKRIQSLLDNLEWIADSATAHHAPEISARNVVKLARVVAELVKHVAAKEQP